MRDFCTYFDHRYLPEGLALYHSLEATGIEFRLWVLCLDEACHAALTRLALPHVHPVPLRELENGDGELLEAKRNRSAVEYIFTLTPSWLRYLLNHYAEIEMITYLDADLYFFADPTPVFEEMGTGSIAIIAHRFPPQLKDREEAGIYNVGWLSFKRDERALTCLGWWRERCIEWCYHRMEDGKYADQKYLDDWPQRFEGVVVLQHKGANLAPWNLANYKLSSSDHGVLVDREPLLFFHFHGLRRLRWGVLDLYLAEYLVQPDPIIVRNVYAPYIRALWHGMRQVVRLIPSAKREFQRSAPPVYTGVSLKARLRAWKRDIIALVRHERVIVLRGRVL